jgi:hypothetical protein
MKIQIGDYGFENNSILIFRKDLEWLKI